MHGLPPCLPATAVQDTLCGSTAMTTRSVVFLGDKTKDVLE
jgi:hypothetical protein